MFQTHVKAGYRQRALRTSAGACAVSGRVDRRTAGKPSEVKAMDEEHLTERMLARERVANVRKHWVRLVTACNSRCVFCLDTDTPRNVYIPDDDVRRELGAGARSCNADKVILSGGEGSIHPKFVDFVRYAKEIGYDRVQTVTNGVMLSKRDFYTRAVEAGLGEITFSLHGHTPELHDRLTGTPGRLPQADEGHDARHPRGSHHRQRRRLHQQAERPVHRPDRRALPVGRRARVRSPARHPAGRGVREPRRALLRSGRAPAAPAEGVPRSTAIPNVVIWTNRFPVEFLEGLEDLIQDPHKMLDEVNGRRFQVRRYLDEGVPLECREKERCQYCFIEPFCNTADRVIERQNQATLGGVVDRRRGRGAVGPYADLTLERAAVRVPVHRRRGRRLADLERLPVHAGHRHLRRRRSRSRAASTARVVRNPLLVSAREPAQLDVLLVGTAIPAGVEVEIELNQRTAPWLLAHRERVRSTCRSCACISRATSS